MKKLKKSDLIISLICYIVFELCIIALTVICFMTCWPVGIATILLGTFIALFIVSTIQEMNGKKPIIKQQKIDTSNAKIPLKRNGLSSFWKAVGILAIVDELSELDEPIPQKKSSILNITDYDNCSLHSEEGHETEDGYCMECDMAVEDMLE